MHDGPATSDPAAAGPRSSPISRLRNLSRHLAPRTSLIDISVELPGGRYGSSLEDVMDIMEPVLYLLNVHIPFKKFIPDYEWSFTHPV